MTSSPAATSASEAHNVDTAEEDGVVPGQTDAQQTGGADLHPQPPAAVGVARALDTACLEAVVAVAARHQSDGQDEPHVRAVAEHTETSSTTHFDAAHAKVTTLCRALDALRDGGGDHRAENMLQGVRRMAASHMRARQKGAAPSK